ncbi:MAG: hypothetical protein ABSC94_09630 [Polyangiaceae bacterium]|jgi:hypothetical protein
MTALTETFTVLEWGGSCGPAPVSRALQRAGPATVQSDGNELVIDDGGRTLRTDECLDGMPTLKHDAHSSDGRTWRTRCSTPPRDPRHATINTAYFLSGGDEISIAETGRYEFMIEGARCIADVKREATAHRVPPTAAGQAGSGLYAPSAALPTPDLPAEGRPKSVDTACSSPGEPARLEVRPSRKLLRQGASYRFRAIVLDANGCPTETPIQWTIAALRSEDGRDIVLLPSIDSTGRLSIPPGGLLDAKFAVVATAADRSARASVEVASAANYDALLAQSGLDPNGERDEPSVAILATTSLGASRARAEDGARRRRLIFIAIVGSLVLGLGLLAAFAALRMRKAHAAERAAQLRHAEKLREYERQKREREERHAADVRAHLESVARAQRRTADAATLGTSGAGPVFCPSCHREFAAGTAFCPFDANHLVALAGHEDIVAGPVGGICPSCRRGFNPGVKSCPHDGEELIPPAMASARLPGVRGKICPTCGGRFEGNAAFCGKDGTMLVLLN